MGEIVQKYLIEQGLQSVYSPIYSPQKNGKEMARCMNFVAGLEYTFCRGEAVRSWPTMFRTDCRQQKWTQHRFKPGMVKSFQLIIFDVLVQSAILLSQMKNAEIWMQRLLNQFSSKNFKARLVAQGFLIGRDYDFVFAPVVKQPTYRIVLSIAAKEKMIVQDLDAKTVFLSNLHETTARIHNRGKRGSCLSLKEKFIRT